MPLTLKFLITMCLSPGLHGEFIVIMRAAILSKLLQRLALKQAPGHQERLEWVSKHAL